MAFSLDMNMADLKEELSKLLNKNKPNNSPATKKEEEKGESSVAKQGQEVVIVAVIIFSVILTYIFLYYIPSKDEINKKITLLQEIEEQQSELSSLSDQIQNRTKQLKSSQKNYKRILSYFDKSKELEDLYTSVNNLAINNKLSVANIRSSSPPPRTQKTPPAEGAEPQKVKKYQDNVVTMSLTGKYANYIEFKEALLNAKKLLTIHNEVISTLPNKRNTSTKVKIDLNLSTYTIDKEPYLEILNDEI